MAVTSEASGSAYFRLGPPRVYGAGDHVRLVGQVCRRYRTTELSPFRVRVEHRAADGALIGVANAGVPAIYDYGDRPCAIYSASADWRFAPGETLRACLDRGRPCSPEAPAKADVSAPAS